MTQAEINAETIKEFVIAGHGDLEKVQSMLAENPDLLEVAHEWSPGDFETALLAASHVGNREIAEYLLGEGAAMHICTAAMLGLRDEVREALKAEPELANSTGAHNISILFHAAYSGDPRMTQLLLDHGAELSPSALFAGIYSESAEMVQWMLDKGANDLSIKNWQEKTPLDVAEALGNEEVLAVLRAAR